MVDARRPAEDPEPTQRIPEPALSEHGASEMADELRAAGFECDSVIGRGGFGVVYRCREPDLDRTVAVKVLTAFDGANTARFLREEHALGRLTGHPNIVSALRVGRGAAGHPYIVMPYYAQGSLADRIRTAGPVGLEVALRWGVKLAGALASAHRADILHRDVKPANILLTDYGEPVLADFGIAHLPGSFETAAGLVTGSPAYVAPEILAGRSPTAAADVYGLGATLFAALTGHAAFELGSRVIAEDVAAAVDRAMSADPAARPSAIEFGTLLRTAQARHGYPVDTMMIPGDGAEQRAVPASPAGRRDAPSGNVPAEVTTFVGRRRELADAKNLLASARLVTLTGMSGVGKSRLAVQVVSGVRRKFDDGVWMVELAEIRDPSLLVGTIVAVLGFHDRAMQRPDERLDCFLTGRSVLLVLDSCEHLIDAVAALVARLLRAHPGLRVLATSLEPLGVRGEAVLRVPPLEVPDSDDQAGLRALYRSDAVKLFADRAASAVPGFTVTDENRDAVARICRQLEGVPLAIELAAARLRAMSLGQLAEGLTDRLSLLTRGARDAPTRQQTLRAGIDWSYELCTRDEQRMWGRLSVFAGDFEMSAAETICSEGLAPDTVRDLVAALVDKSIVIAANEEEPPRFRLLDTLRQYGQERLEDSGERDRLRRRHVHWYRRMILRAAYDWVSPRQLDWLARIDRERANLREAQEYNLAQPGAEHAEAGQLTTAAMFPYWLARGLVSEGRYWLGRALAHTPEQGGRARAAALLAYGIFAVLQSDLPAVSAAVDEVCVLADRSRDRTVRTIATKAAGNLALNTGDVERARDLLEQAREAETDRSLGTSVWDLMTLGLAHDLAGDTARAVACHEEVLAITEQHGECVYRSYSLWALGIVVFGAGDLDRAADLVSQSLRLARLVDEPLTQAVGLEVLGWVACRREDFSRAATLLGAAAAQGAAVGADSVRFEKQMRHRDECEQAAKASLGERAFADALSRGSRLDADAAVAYALGERPGATAALDAGPLTAREREIADLVARGDTNSAIASELVISPRTVAGHVEHILAKLGFSSRTQIAAWVLGADGGADAP